jgi:hypothetical protein
MSFDNEQDQPSKDRDSEGDHYNVSHIQGQDIAIGRNASIQKNSSDTFNMSGDFRGSILNIRSDLQDVNQTIGNIPQADESTKAELQALVKTLFDELQKAPPEKVEQAEAIVELTKDLVDKAAVEKPNKTTLQITGEGLKQAAQNIADVMPTVVSIATKIVATIGMLVI